MAEQRELGITLPSLHLVRAALHVGSIIGERPATLAATRESYWHHATGGTFSPADLRLGEQLLIDCDLINEHEQRLVAAEPLRQLLEGTLEDAISFVCQKVLSSGLAQSQRPFAAAQVDHALAPLIVDEERRRQLLLELGQRFDDARNALIGAIGEECVVEYARHELREVGHAALARAVRRVSLISDQLGYDVVAPRLDGGPRLLEVKTVAQLPRDEFSFYISRNELETGLRSRDWALVACAVVDEDARRAEILGWLAAGALQGCLPADGIGGRWTQALLGVSLQELQPGLPRLVA